MGRAARYRRTAAVNVLGNLGKLLLEGWLGLVFGSTALLADAVDSVADLLTSGIALLWGGQSYQGRDSDHPHGHSRVEPLIAFVIGLIMVIAGLRLGAAALDELIHSSGTAGSLLLVAGAGGAALLKLVLYLHNTRQAAALDSASLHALAKDTLNDVYKSVGVGIGVLGSSLGYTFLDGVAGLLVSTVVLAQGIAIVRENTQYLTGAGPGRPFRRTVNDILLDDDDVHGVHDLVIHHLGTGYEVEVHVEVDGDMPLREAHSIETRLVERLRDEGQVTDAHVHLDPSGIGEWKDAD